MINSHSQKGGDGSSNYQAEKMVVHVGIDEKRAREIYQEMNLQLRNDYSQEAVNIANTRVKEFENKLLPKMEKVNGALEAFADPSFQLLLVEAQKAAASTERPNDHDLLSELLIDRFKRGQNRIVRAGISIAVEIVDKVSDEALLGLTVAHAVGRFTPASGDILKGLDLLNVFFGELLYGELPKGIDWLDHLDILNSVRLRSSESLKKVNQYYPETLQGYVDVGIAKDSENHDKAIQILKLNNLPTNALVDHALNKDFIRILTPHRNQINKIKLNQTFITNEGVPTIVLNELSEAQIKAIESIYDLYSQDSNLKQNNVNSFMAEWEKRPNLKVLREWWDNIATPFSITSVGQVLAHSNAQRCYKDLPQV